MIETHLKFLIKAHNLAKKKFGSTFPNPVVGCVIVNNNKIISTGVTASEGRPHAEEIALRKAGDKVKGSTMYVTLEPCFHSSKNGSCADQILRYGLKNIYIARHDPDKRTNKKSINKLKKNGLKVIVGKTANYSNSLNNFFFQSLLKKMPFTKVKMAISKDQKIAWGNYKSKWISNSFSRDYAHQIRLKSQAILTTSKTVIKDNPRFTIRKNNNIIKYIPIIIIDSGLKIPLNSNVLKNISKKRIIIFTSSFNKKTQYLKKRGCEIIVVKKQKNNQLNLKFIFKKIYELKIYDILVEAGGIFFTNMLKNNLVDELHLFSTNKEIGKNGIPMIIGKKFEDYNFDQVFIKKFKNDVYQNFKLY